MSLTLLVGYKSPRFITLYPGSKWDVFRHGIQYLEIFATSNISRNCPVKIISVMIRTYFGPWSSAALKFFI